MRVIILICAFIVCSSASPSRFLNFLLQNKASTSNLPLSYKVPANYWRNIVPANQSTASEYIEMCGRVVSQRELDAYTFQTEQILTTAGINLYDAAIRSVALSILGQVSVARDYEDQVLVAGRTFQLGSIRGSAPCKGIQFYGQCSGGCGFCYGGYDSQHTGATLDDTHAYFFRLISDIWAFQGVIDARCPEKNYTWTWNDWRPVAGENAWANFLGPLQNAYIQAGGNVNNIADTSSAMKLAVTMFSTFQKVQMPNGAIAYAPWNSYDVGNSATGGTGSVENAASALAGLKALRYVIQNKQTTTYKSLLPDLETVISKLTGFIKSSYHSEDGFFVQGGAYDLNGQFQWNPNPKSRFAVDCQTWVISVIGGPTIDSWFGAGTTLNIWKKTKILGGFHYLSSVDTARGLGFSINSDVKVFSGEWTFGGINMLKILAKQYPDNATVLLNEADYMRQNVEDLLTHYDTTLQSDVVYYSNKRYWIPWGWYANPIPSSASISWAVMVDSNFNPFVLGGSYV